MSIQIKDFGKTTAGQPVKVGILANDTIEVHILSYGATIQQLLVPDRKGNKVDVVLGYPTVQDYELKDGVLRCLVEDKAAFYKQDPTRVLALFTASAAEGCGIDDDTYAAAMQAVGGIARLHAKVVREAAKEISGGGGGQPFYATAGGKDAAGIEKAIFRAVELIKTQLKR